MRIRGGYFEVATAPGPSVELNEDAFPRVSLRIWRGPLPIHPDDSIGFQQALNPRQRVARLYRRVGHGV
jgi:hypothetical protein